MTVWVWVGFVALIMGLVFLDLGVFHRKSHAVGIREALGWTAIWVAVSLVFNVFVYFLYDRHWLGWTGTEGLTGSEAALQFFTGYLVEKSLSVDNIFVIAMVFNYFRIPSRLQHRVLFWGILGAVAMRGAMIALGAVLIHQFTWTIPVFGLLLIASALKMLWMSEDIHPDRNFAVIVARRFFPVKTDISDERFFVKVEGIRTITPLFLALVLVETSDVMFAVDSIPAVFAITQDPFLVFTSNVFAILGLRSLYFALAGLMDKFAYLKYSLVALLTYVGVKMLISRYYHIPNAVSLGIIIGLLTVGVVASLILAKRDEDSQAESTDIVPHSEPTHP